MYLLKTQKSLFKYFSNVVHTRIFLKTNFKFNAAIADVYTIWVPVYLLTITDFIFQQYIAICNKCTSVPLTNSHCKEHVLKLWNSDLNFVTTI